MSRGKSPSFNDDDIPLASPPPRQPSAGAFASPASPPVTPPSTPPVYPAPQPPVVPQKNSSGGCGFIVAALVVLGIIGIIAASSHSSFTPVLTPTPTPFPYTLTWDHTAYSSYSYTYNGQLWRPRSGNHFEYIKVTINNVTGTLYSLDPHLTFSLYSDGVQASWGVAGFMPTTFAIQPYSARTFEIVFVIPDDACGSKFSITGLGQTSRWNSREGMRC